MLTIRLNIEENSFDRVMQSLRVFASDEVMIINEDQNFTASQSYLFKESKEINNGAAEFVCYEPFGKLFK